MEVSVFLMPIFVLVSVQNSWKITSKVALGKFRINKNYKIAVYPKKGTATEMKAFF